MSPGKPHAVPGSGSALRAPSRPPIPGDDPPAAQPPAVPAARPPVQPAAQPPVRQTVEPAREPASKLASPIASQPVDEADAEPAARPVDQPGAELPGPPVVERVARVQLNSKIEIGLLGRTKQFTADHQSTLQAVIEAALGEYMDRRGYTEQEHSRKSRRRG